MVMFTSIFSRILRNSTAVTLMALSSVSAFAMNSAEVEMSPHKVSRKPKQISGDQQLTPLPSRIGFTGSSDIEFVEIEMWSPEGGWDSIWQLNMGDPASESQPGVHVYGPETDGDANTWSKAQNDAYRVAGDNPDARIKHSAVAFQLLNKDIQPDAAYELIVNHRTQGVGPLVRLYDPGARDYINLQNLPQSSEFIDTTFDLKDWRGENMLGGARGPEESLAKEPSYLSFINGKSDIHSFTLKSNGKTIKQVILGDVTSESQPGVTVYAPEKDRGDIKTNQWSEAHEPTHYFRKAGANLNAIHRHATLSFKLPSELVKDESEYRLSVTHRSAPGAQVKMFDVGTNSYLPGRNFPSSPDFITSFFPLDPTLIKNMQPHVFSLPYAAPPSSLISSSQAVSSVPHVTPLAPVFSSFPIEPPQALTEPGAFQEIKEEIQNLEVILSEFDLREEDQLAVRNQIAELNRTLQSDIRRASSHLQVYSVGEELKALHALLTSADVHNFEDILKRYALLTQAEDRGIEYYASEEELTQLLNDQGGIPSASPKEPPRHAQPFASTEYTDWLKRLTRNGHALSQFTGIGEKQSPQPSLSAPISKRPQPKKLVIPEAVKGLPLVSLSSPRKPISSPQPSALQSPSHLFRPFVDAKDRKKINVRFVGSDLSLCKYKTLANGDCGNLAINVPREEGLEIVRDLRPEQLPGDIAVNNFLLEEAMHTLSIPYESNSVMTLTLLGRFSPSPFNVHVWQKRGDTYQRVNGDQELWQVPHARDVHVEFDGEGHFSTLIPRFDLDARKHAIEKEKKTKEAKAIFELYFGEEGSEELLKQTLNGLYD